MDIAFGDGRLRQVIVFRALRYPPFVDRAGALVASKDMCAERDGGRDDRMAEEVTYGGGQGVAERSMALRRKKRTPLDD